MSTQYLPLVKRCAKVRVDAVHLGHSGMDIYEDVRRSQITTEFVFKTALKTAEAPTPPFNGGRGGPRQQTD